MINVYSQVEKNLLFKNAIYSFFWNWRQIYYYEIYYLYPKEEFFDPWGGSPINLSKFSTRMYYPLKESLLHYVGPNGLSDSLFLFYPLDNLISLR